MYYVKPRLFNVDLLSGYKYWVNILLNVRNRPNIRHVDKRLALSPLFAFLRYGCFTVGALS